MIFVNRLADNAFKHQIILNNVIVLPITTTFSYIFILSTDLQYNNIEFKKLIIVFKALNQLTGVIWQLKAWYQLDICVELNKNTNRSDNLIIRIGRITSVCLVKKDISPRQVFFHIVSDNILFLLFLVDRDKLGAFYNNITNKMI